MDIILHRHFQRQLWVFCFIFMIRNIMKKWRKENAHIENYINLVWEVDLLVNTVEGMSLVIAQLLEVTVLVSVACWCVKCKNESYSSGESCICHVYCLIKPIHLSTHWMPIKLHRMVQVYGGWWCQTLLQLSFSGSVCSCIAKWQTYQSQIKCSWNNAFKEEEMPQSGTK